MPVLQASGNLRGPPAGQSPGHRPEQAGNAEHLNIRILTGAEAAGCVCVTRALKISFDLLFAVDSLCRLGPVLCWVKGSVRISYTSNL